MQALFETFGSKLVVEMETSLKFVIASATFRGSYALHPIQRCRQIGG